MAAIQTTTFTKDPQLDLNAEGKEGGEEASVAESDAFLSIVPWEHDPVSDQVPDENALSEGWYSKAYQELQEKKEWRQRDIQALREMLPSKKRTILFE